jgi:hypothetical protein
VQRRWCRGVIAEQVQRWCSGGVESRGAEVQTRCQGTEADKVQRCRGAQVRWFIGGAEVVVHRWF